MTIGTFIEHNWFFIIIAIAIAYFIYQERRKRGGGGLPMPQQPIVKVKIGRQFLDVVTQKQTIEEIACLTLP